MRLADLCQNNPMIDHALLIDRMEIALQQSGYIATHMQGRVSNDKKEMPFIPSDNAFLTAVKQAKTVVDEIVQEVLLLAIKNLINPKELYLSVEEETPSVSLFAQSPTDTSLVIDPIDGTLGYLEGKDDYSICLGLVRDGVMDQAFVSFAARNHCYFIDENGKAALADQFSEKGFSSAKTLEPKSLNNKKLIYGGHYLSNEVAEHLTTLGYRVVSNLEDITCPDAVAQCLEGNALCYINNNYQMHDLLLPAVIAKAPGGYAINWHGEPLVWPAKGRVAQSVFGIQPLPIEVLAVLKSFAA